MREATHEDLRKRAVKWLTNTCRCGVVLSEMVSVAGETPDAIGWNGGRSILVERKVSRADFHANKTKLFSRVGGGVGRQRYFLCPERLLTEADVAGSDYGLLWDRGSHITKVVQAPPRESDLQNEVYMLTSALRRVKVREFLIVVSESTLPIATQEQAGA